MSDIFFPFFRIEILQNTLSGAAYQVMILQTENTLQQLMDTLDISLVQHCTDVRQIWIDFTYKTRENTAELTGYSFEEYRCPNEFLLIPNVRWDIPWEVDPWELPLDLSCNRAQLWRPDPDVMPR